MAVTGAGVCGAGAGVWAGRAAARPTHASRISARFMTDSFEGSRSLHGPATVLASDIQNRVPGGRGPSLFWPKCVWHAPCSTFTVPSLRGVALSLLLLVVLLGACSAPVNSAPARLPATLTVLVQEDHGFYYRNETDEWVGFQPRAHRQDAASPGGAGGDQDYSPARKRWSRRLQPARATSCAPRSRSTGRHPTRRLLTEIEHQRFPTLRMKVSDDEDFVWVLRKDLGGAAALLNEWLRTTRSQLFVANLYSKHFAHLGLLNKFDLVMLKVRYRRDLPKYRVLFEEAGRRYDLDPLFLAAMSYQESHWDPAATSYTGVRGLMMLTQDTAAAIGVTDRTDPRQSVLGGTRYLVQIMKQIDDEVGRPDDNYYALAAYNVGLGHVAGRAGDRQAQRRRPHLVEQPARRAAIAVRTVLTTRR